MHSYRYIPLSNISNRFVGIESTAHLINMHYFPPNVGFSNIIIMSTISSVLTEVDANMVGDNA